MSTSQKVNLTPQQFAVLNLRLNSTSATDIAVARQFKADADVQTTYWNKEKGILRALIHAVDFYECTLFLNGAECGATCACGTSNQCTHVLALILWTLDNSALESSQRPEVDSVLGGRQEQVSLMDLLKRKREPRLHREATRFLTKVEEFWRKKKQRFSFYELCQLCEERRSWHWSDRTFFVWPGGMEPVDVVDYLVHVAVTLKTVELYLPGELEADLDPQHLKLVQEKIHRASLIKKWRDSFRNWEDPSNAFSEELPVLRLLLTASGAQVQVQYTRGQEFGKVTKALLKKLWGDTINRLVPANNLDPGSNLVLKASRKSDYEFHGSEIPAMSQTLGENLRQLFFYPEWRDTHVVNSQGKPLVFSDASLQWKLLPPSEKQPNYALYLCDATGAEVPAPTSISFGTPLHYFTANAVYPLQYWPFGAEPVSWPEFIPAEALETIEGVGALAKLELPVPERLKGRVKILPVKVSVRCRIHTASTSNYLQVHATTIFPDSGATSIWHVEGWASPSSPKLARNKETEEIVQVDNALQRAAGAWLRHLKLRPSQLGDDVPGWLEERLSGKDWPEEVLKWLDRRPKEVDVEVDNEIASLREGSLAGKVRLDLEESASGIDWFDLSVALDVSDHTLTPQDIALLLKAKGKWVKLSGKGWRKLEFEMSETEIRELAELGLAVKDFGTEKHRLHALQLGALHGQGSGLVSAERVEQVRRRVEEIQTRVTPPLPESITASLRPYQMEGFHFLAYLTVNHFGGVLADDMGLGKTLQTLAWLAWLRNEQNVESPILVVCPKSVQANWRNEVARFFPKLTVALWEHDKAGEIGLQGEVNLLIINYAQLRIHSTVLCAQEWGALILDEAQAIKNPSSQNFQTACALKSKHRLALTGTPIENRLLDLWSIFSFAMPGVLGSRASFIRDFDAKEDVLARRRLAARTRPFLLRRTKNEVARDLPDRVEEDLLVELEGVQADLYKAEIKRARAELLHAQISEQLDKMRFHILTSLLRLRQICCHPRLLGLEPGKTKKTGKAKVKNGSKEGGEGMEAAHESAKVLALMELLEPILEEGGKVLIFSQFVEMLAILEAEIALRGWKSFILTGQTQDRGTLVDAFQAHEGAATFLISLKAGGAGLNLTAASYVVLFDPWWNPAVEAQAIDRTHRIGQKQTVFAYRLIVKNSIEEKIRLLQKQKGALASDILGEENFAQALTLSDFQFLLGN